MLCIPLQAFFFYGISALQGFETPGGLFKSISSPSAAILPY